MIHLVPLLWPKDKRKLQRQLPGFFFCALIEYGLKIAVPLQLARIADMEGGPDVKRHILLYIGAMYLSSGPMSILKRMFLRPLLDDIDVNMKTKFFSHVMGLSRDFHDEANAAKLGSLILDSPAGAEFTRLVVVDWIPLVMDFFIPLCILYHHFGSYVVMASALTIVLNLWLSGRLMLQQTTCFVEFNRADKHQHSVFYKSIENWLAAIYFGQTDREKSCYAEAIQKMVESGRRYSYWSYIRSVMSSTILYAGCAWITLLLPEGLGSTGNFILLVTCWHRLFRTTSEIIRIEWEDHRAD
jgi:ATP-binding cassette subfamily B protein